MCKLIRGERERDKLQKDINCCNYGIKKEYVSSFYARRK